MKRVLICSPVLLIGGTEMHMLNLVGVLSTSGYQVTVCCYYEFADEMVSEFRRIGIEVILMGFKRSDGLIRLILGLRKLFNKLKPDIIHIQYVAPGFIPVLTAYLAGIKPIFASVHQPGTPYGRKEKFLLRMAAKLSTAFFCVSQSAERSWFGDSALWNLDAVKNGRKHFTIYNGVDCEHIQRIANEIAQGDLKASLGLTGRPVVGVVGRLRKEKGHAWLFEAIKHVIKVIPDVILLVVGDGPDRESLKQKAENLGISQNVIWAGQKLPEEVYRLHALMDVVVVPSLFEGFGLTAAEAMAARRPVVASSVEGLSEVVADSQTGYLLPPGNSKVLAEALVKLLKNPELREKMGQRGHRRVVENFGMERFTESMSAVYSYYAH